MGEDKGGAGDVADFAKPCGDGWRVRQRPVSKANPCSPEAAQGALEGVAGAVIDVEFPAAGRLPDRAPACSGVTPLCLACE